MRSGFVRRSGGAQFAEQARQFRPRRRTALLAGTAFTGAFVAAIACHPGSALAQSCSTSGAGPVAVLCDAPGSTITTTNTTNSTSPNAATNDRRQSFGVDVIGTVTANTTIDGFGLDFRPPGAAPPITVTMTNNGAVTTNQAIISALNLAGNGGTVTYSGNGSAINSNAGGGSGLTISNTGSGSVLIGLPGTTVVPNFQGTTGFDVSTQAGAITAYLNGGSITAIGGVTNHGVEFTTGTGAISATFTGNTAVVNGGIGGALRGISASSTSGGVSIVSDANVGSAAARFGFGIYAESAGADPITINQTGGAIYAAASALLAMNTGGSGSVNVTTAAGSTIDAGGIALWATTNGTGNVNVMAAGTITAGNYGIFARNFGVAGDVTVNVATGAAVSAVFHGIFATNSGNGRIDITVGPGATVAGGAGNYGAFLSSGGTKTLTNSGTISGSSNGVGLAGGSGTVTNFGSIVGLGGIAVSLTGAGNLLVMSGPNATLTGNVVGGGADPFRFAGAGSNSFNAGQIGAGWALIDKTETSNWTLTGTSTTTAAITVNDGTLSVDGNLASASGFTVNPGGTLGGTGTVGNTTINGGTLAPGNSIGTLTVSGSLTFTAASTYLVQISGADSDNTNVTGTATLAGKVTVDPLTRIATTTTYKILTAGTVSGTFGSAGFLTANSFATNARLSYVDNDVWLTVDPGLLSPNLPANATINQKNVAAGIDNALNAGANMPAGFNALFALAGTGLANALTQVSGETATGSQQTTFNAMNLFMGVMTDPFIAGRGDPISAGGNPNAFADEQTLAYAARRRPHDAPAAIYTKAPPVAPVFAQRWSVWAAGFGGSQTTSGHPIVLGSNNTRSSLAAGAVGADYRISPNTLAGFALAGGGTHFRVNGFGSGRSDLFQAGAFIRHNVGPAYITGALAYGWQDITTDRTVTVAGVDQLRAKFNANAWSGRVEGGYRFVSHGFGWTPYAAGQFTTFELPAYAEQAIVGANTFALAYNAKSVTSTRSELGLRTDKSFAVPNGIFTLRGRAAWAHDFNPDRSIGATFQTLPGASFVVNGARQAADAALVTGSAEMKWINGWSIAGTFEGEFSNVTESYAGKGVVRYAW